MSSFTDRYGIGPGPAFAFLVLPYAYLRRRAPVGFAIFVILPVPCVPHVPWYFVPFFPYTHITSIAIVYSRFTSIAIYEVPKETSHVQL